MRQAALDTFAFQDALTDLLDELFELDSEEAVYERVLHAALELVPGAQAGSITVRGEDDRFRFVAAVGFDLEQLARVSFSYAETFFLFETEARSFVIENLSVIDRTMLDPERYEILRKAGRIEEIRSTLMAPIRIGGEVAASLLLDAFTHPEAFTEESRRSAEVFAALIGVVLKRLRLEREKVALLAELSRVFQQSFVAAVMVDPASGRIIDCNESFLALVGFERDELIGQSREVLSSIVDETWLERVLDGLGKDKPGVRGEVALLSKRGERLWCLASAERLEPLGERYGLLSFIDITERKQSEEDLARAIQEVMDDTSWLRRALAARLMELRALRRGGRPSERLALTKREREVLGLVASGHTNAQIAARLGLAETTVRNYVAQVYQKIGVHSRAEAVVWARERGMIV